MKFLKKSAVTLASIAVLTVGATNIAYADSYAFANLNINNLTMSDGAGNVLVAGTDVLLPNGVNDGQVNNANLGGPNTQTIDGTMACIGDCGGIAQNDFTLQPVGLNFSRSDSDIAGTIIEIPAVSPGGVTARSVAETQLTSNTMSNSQSTVSTNTEFEFILGQATQVQFDFSATGTLYAEQTIDNNVPPSFAQAGSSFSIVITEVLTGNTVFFWSPDGFVGVNATVTELQDDQGLTQNRAATSAGQSISEVINGTFSAISTAALSDNVRYTLSINHTTNVLATRDVPEPAALFVLALGLMGFAARRKLS